MGGPWEKYQNAATEQPAGPWNKYATATEPASVVPSANAMVDASGEEAIQPYDFTGAAKTAASIGLPMAAYGAGAAAGALIPGAGPWVGPMVTGPLAAGGMEYINQKLGISDGGPLSVASEVLLPGAASGGVRLLKQVPRMLPGSSAALQMEAAGAARKLHETHIAAPAVPSRELFKELQQVSPTALPVDKLNQAAVQLGGEESIIRASLKNPKILELVDDFKNVPGMTVDELRANAKRLNKMISDAEDGEVKGALLRLKGGMQQSLDDAIHAADDGEQLSMFLDQNLGRAPETTRVTSVHGQTLTQRIPEEYSPPAMHSEQISIMSDVDKKRQAELLRNAWKATRREMAADEFGQMVEKTGIRKVQEFNDQVNANAIANWIKHPDQKFWRDSLDQSELKAIDKTLQEWSRLPNAPTKRGVAVGSSLRNVHIAGGAAAGAPFGPVGAAVGAVAVPIAGDLIARGLMTDAGRRFMTRMFKISRGNVGEREAGMLGAFLSGGMNPLDAERNLQEPISVTP